MPSLNQMLMFGLVALSMVLTPGPNMIYLVSRSICQGRGAGLVSLCGVALGFVCYMLLAAFGLTAFITAIPVAYDALRFGGAAYLLYLAWQAVKPGGISVFTVRALPIDDRKKLFMMGFITNMANPKIAVMYLSLLPQFIKPGNGSLLTQSLTLGTIQILISLLVNATIIALAGSLAGFLARNPRSILIQRWMMGTVLTALAVRMASQTRA